jgi:DNA processing protein
VTEREAALALVGARGVGPATADTLRRRYGTYRGAMERAPHDRAVPRGVRRALADRSGSDVSAELRLLDREGIEFAELGGAGYPELLSRIHRPPPGIFLEGTPPGSGLAVAVVGARRASERSLTVARALGRSLAARGVTVVSGLARGVDAAAHSGALASGGPTVAVLGSGLRRIYPPEHAGLARAVRDAGCVISEFPPDVAPRPSLFPRRNRVIAGLSAAVVVVEAGERSGSLITAAFGLDEGREVFACPGPAGERRCRGSNRLIREGARLVESAEDVLEDLEPAWGPLLCAAAQPDIVPWDVSEEARRLLGHLSLDPRTPDEAASLSDGRIEQVLAALLELELSGAARRVAGGRYVISDEEAARRGIGGR